MENIVMATQAGLPLADGSTPAGNGVDTGAGGLFGLLVDAELALLSGNAKNGKKGKTGDGANPLAALLMASLFQGRGAAAETGSAAQQPAQTDQTAQTNAPAGAGAPGGNAGMALLELLAANDGAGRAFTRLFASGGDAGSALQALLGTSVQGPEDLAGMFGDAAESGGNAFPALLAALTGGQEGGEAAPAPAPAQASGSLQALDEIRRLFAELIGVSQETAVQEDPPAKPDAAPAVQAKPEGAPAPVEDAPALEKAVADLIDGLASGGARESAAGNAGSDGSHAAGAAERPSVRAAGDATDDGADQTGETKKEPADFSPALRAYHADAAKAADAGHPSEKSAALALRRGSEAFDSIVDTIRTMSGSQQKDMEIRLKPDFLGRVVIKLTMDGDGLVAKIAASNPKVQDAFLNQVPSLQSSLAEQGLKDVRIVVTTGFVEDAALQQQAQGRGQWRQEKQKRDRGAVESVDGQAAAGPALAYEMAYRSGTVDRLA